MFPQIIAQLSLIRYVYNNAERGKRAEIVCFMKTNISRRVCRRFHEANIVGVPWKRAQHCCATLRRSQNNRNVWTCCAKSLTGFKLYATSANIVVVAWGLKVNFSLFLALALVPYLAWAFLSTLKKLSERYVKKDARK